jgi:hypothetical protein
MSCKDKVGQAFQSRRKERMLTFRNGMNERCGGGEKKEQKTMKYNGTNIYSTKKVGNIKCTVF